MNKFLIVGAMMLLVGGCSTTSINCQKVVCTSEQWLEYAKMQQRHEQMAKSAAEPSLYDFNKRKE